jgi:ABC-2 type transport system permease protein
VPAAIAVEGLERAFDEVLAVQGIDLSVEEGEIYGFLGLNGVFGALTQLKGFSTGSYESYIVPVSMLQGAGFTGAAAGVNLARDIEQGWLDRLLVSPAPRWVLLAGTVLAAGARALIPATFVLSIALVLGAGWPGIDGLLVTYFMVAAMAAVAATWSDTWPGLLALAGLLAILGALALREMPRTAA